MSKRLILLVLVLGVAGAGVAYANLWSGRVPVKFYEGHTHDQYGKTHGAPDHSSETLAIDAHSGGTDKNGCHNASVPYHCH